MKLVTDTYTLVIEDGRFDLKQHDTSDEAWLNARRGDVQSAAFAIKDGPGDYVHVFLNHQDIGRVRKDDTDAAAALYSIVEYLNTSVAPTDHMTARLAALLHHRTQLKTTRTITIQALTWNTNGRLALFPEETWAILDQSADLLVLAFQETDVLNRNLKANGQTLAVTVRNVEAQLSATHSLVTTVQLLGIMTLVFMKHDIKQHVTEVKTSSSGTGFLGVWGNKGAVLARFTLLGDSIVGHGVTFDIVNCHLSAGEEPSQVTRRRWELQEISSKFGIQNLMSADADRADEDLPDPEADSSSTVSLISEDSNLDDDGLISEPPRYNSDMSSPGGTATSSRVISPGPDLLFDDSECSDAASSSTNKKPPVVEHTRDTGTTVKQPLNQSPTQVGTPASAQPLSGNAIPVDLPPNRMVILLGDLNYRVTLGAQQVRECITKGHVRSLLKHDTLLREVAAGHVFQDFVEGDITFPPTYKFAIGTSRYTTRIPSYTDRILLRTACPFDIKRYASILNHQSDHVPVEASIEIEVGCFDVSKRNELVAGAHRLVDRAENNARPKITAVPVALESTGSVIGVVSGWVTISYESSQVIDWEIRHGPDVQVHPQRGHLLSKASKIELLVTAKMRPDVPKVEDVLVFHPSGGSDIFIPVTLAGRPSILGQSLESLSRLRNGPRNPPVGDQVNNVPTQIWQCVDYLWDKPVPDMFLVPGEPSIVEQVLEWLDSGDKFDVDVLDKSNSTDDNAGMYAVVNVLKRILLSLPEPVIPPSLVAKLRTVMGVYETLPALNANVLIYLVGFFQHVFSFGVPRAKALPVLAKLLMGHEGNEEKKVKLLIDLLAK